MVINAETRVADGNLKCTHRKHRQWQKRVILQLKITVLFFQLKCELKVDTIDQYDTPPLLNIKTCSLYK